MTNPPTGIDALIQKYCLMWRPRDAGPGEMVPEQARKEDMGNHNAEAFIDGAAYFKAIYGEIRYLINNKSKPNRFFYLSAWALSLLTLEKKLTVSNSWSFPLRMTAMELDQDKGTLFERLIELDQSGADVRVMAWVSPFVGHELVAKYGGAGGVNLPTLRSVLELQKKLPGKAVLNMLAHSMGAAHCKLVICGDSTRMRAFTSGMDPLNSRLDPPALGEIIVTNPKTKQEESRVVGGWHDVGVRIEGAAAAAIHDFFAAMWNEQLKRKVETFQLDDGVIVSHSAACQPIAKRAPIALRPGTGKQYVQVLRTVPQMNFNQAGPLRRGALLFPTFIKPAQAAIGAYVNQKGFQRPTVSFAPNGIFEFKLALQHAIAAADRYIFIADQALFGLPIMDWINRRMRANPNLRVILLYGVDPADPPNNFLSEAINQHLCYGLPTEKVAGNNGSFDLRPRNIVFAEWYKSTVHAKVTIIDDVWCAIGSANCMRRSLFTDIELSVSVCEQPTADNQLPATWAEEQALPRGKKDPSFVQCFRRDLWAHYCGLPLDEAGRISSENNNNYTALLSLERALSIWNYRWGRLIPGLSLSSGRRYAKDDMGVDGEGLQEGELFKEIRAIPLPLPEPKTRFRQGEYDRYDTDSTQRF